MRWLLVCVVLLASHCSYGTLTVDTLDEEGNLETVRYSKYFEGAVALRENTAGLHLVIDAEKRRIPILYGIQKSLGALGPGDASSKGVITAYVHNLTNRPIRFEVVDVRHGGASASAVPVFVEIPAGRVGRPARLTSIDVTRQYGAHGTPDPLPWQLDTD